MRGSKLVHLFTCSLVHCAMTRKRDDSILGFTFHASRFTLGPRLEAYQHNRT